MGQETRKDPRAKVLTMTVRYKSATLDEFIEHHSHDVSRGGMFIKTPSPFPPGTLLKFEVKIAEDQKVIQGVGRVVWKRESETGDKERPSGMGVKFIKIDDVSRKTIDTLVDSREGAGAAYEAGGGDGGSSKTVPSVTPAAAMTPAMPEASPAGAKPAMPRKATMIGLGAMGSHAAAAAAKAAESSPPPSASNMFPSSNSEADMPAPEDRTVMKQAAELLQDALREAGGSMDDVGTKSDAVKKPAAEAAKASPAAPEADKSEAPAGEKGPHTLRSEPPKSEKKPEQKAASTRPAAASPRSDRPAASSSPARSSARPQPILSERPPANEGGGGRIMIILAGIAVAAGAVFFLTKKDPAPTPTPEVPAAAPTPAATPTPPATEEVKPAEPPPSAAAPVESASAAPTPSAAPAPSVTAALKPTPAAPVVPTPAPKPAPVPAAPKPPKPPKPAPAEPAGDNPY